jgi:hypothetical protein
MSYDDQPWVPKRLEVVPTYPDEDGSDETAYFVEDARKFYRWVTCPDDYSGFYTDKL